MSNGWPFSLLNGPSKWATRWGLSTNQKSNNLYTIPRPLNGTGLSTPQTWAFQGSSLDVPRAQRGPPSWEISKNEPYSSWVFMGYNPQEPLENTINTMGTLLVVHPTVPISINPRHSMQLVYLPIHGWFMFIRSIRRQIYNRPIESLGISITQQNSSDSPMGEWTCRQTQGCFFWVLKNRYFWRSQDSWGAYVYHKNQPSI